MKRYLNLILFASNTIMGIGVVLVLAFILKNTSSTDIPVDIQYNNIRWLLALPIVACFLSCVGIGAYLYLTHKFLKEIKVTINPKLVLGLNYSAYASILNLILPLILSIVSILIRDRTASIVLSSVSIGFCALFSIIISGYNAYINYGITFSILSREELKKIADKNNDKKHESSANKDKQEDPEIDQNIKQEASAGGFNDL